MSERQLAEAIGMTHESVLAGDPVIDIKVSVRKGATSSGREILEQVKSVLIASREGRTEAYADY